MYFICCRVLGIIPDQINQFQHHQIERLEALPEAAIPGWKHPAPFRTWKLSSRGPYQYWARRLPGNVRCCFFLLFPYMRSCNEILKIFYRIDVFRCSYGIRLAIHVQSLAYSMAIFA